MLLGHAIDCPSALGALGCACRVLAGGNGVQEVRLPGSSCGRVPIAQNVIHDLGDKPAAVHLDT